MFHWVIQVWGGRYQGRNLQEQENMELLTVRGWSIIPSETLLGWEVAPFPTQKLKRCYSERLWVA